MIQSFKDKGTKDIFDGNNSKVARKACPRSLWKLAAIKLDRLDSIEDIDELRVPPGNRLEMLGGDRIGQHSIRINRQYRICFYWHRNGPDKVEIDDYH